MAYECGMAAQAGQVNSNGCYCFGVKFETHAHEVVPDLFFSVLSVHAFSFLSFCYA